MAWTSCGIRARGRFRTDRGRHAFGTQRAERALNFLGNSCANLSLRTAQCPCEFGPADALQWVPTKEKNRIPSPRQVEFPALPYSKVSIESSGKVMYNTPAKDFWAGFCFTIKLGLGGISWFEDYHRYLASDTSMAHFFLPRDICKLWRSQVLPLDQKASKSQDYHLFVQWYLVKRECNRSFGIKKKSGSFRIKWA